MSKEFIKYSEEEIQRARNVDMLKVIEQFKGYSFRQDGSGYRCVEHNSLFVQNDRFNWFWNSHSVGGAGAVSWLMRVEGYDFTTAVGTLINRLPSEQFNISGYKFSAPSSPASMPDRKGFKLPEKAKERYSNVFMYLTKARCIDPEIVKYCFRNDILYQDERRNCVFVGYNEFNEPKFAELRSSSATKKFRQNLQGSDKAFSFNIRAVQPSNRVFVFESPIDLLSHASLNCINVKKLCSEKGLNYDPACWLKHNRLSLSGTSYAVALEAYLERYPEIKCIACCLDNDATGKETAQKIYDYFTPQGYLVTIHRPSIGKDYNDTLVALSQQQSEKQPAFLSHPNSLSAEYKRNIRRKTYVWRNCFVASELERRR